MQPIKNKLLLFDLDGVLVSTKELHFEAFNKALEVFGLRVLSYQEHLRTYDGLSTLQKIAKYSEEISPIEDPNTFWRKKQDITNDLIRDNQFFKIRIAACFKQLKASNKICICTNTIKETAQFFIKSLGIEDYVDRVYCNTDVVNPKPAPDIYEKPIRDFGFSPKDVFIFEDSPNGVRAAATTGAKVIVIKSPEDIHYKNINDLAMKASNKKSFLDINIVVPMAGEGSRFRAAGFENPKPLININGKAMIEMVVENFGFMANFIFLVRKEHREKFNLDEELSRIAPNCKIVEVEKLTQGAASTTMLAKDLLNNDKETILINSDQFIDTNIFDFIYEARNKGVDASYLCFWGDNPKFSFVKVDAGGFVTEAAEKNPISNIANVGLYYWRYGSDFCKYTEQMIEKNIRVNGEFYSSLAANEALLDGKKITAKIIDSNRFWCLGDPESLDFYLKNFKK